MLLNCCPSWPHGRKQHGFGVRSARRRGACSSCVGPQGPAVRVRTVSSRENYTTVHTPVQPKEDDCEDDLRSPGPKAHIRVARCTGHLPCVSLCTPICARHRGKACNHWLIQLLHIAVSLCPSMLRPHPELAWAFFSLPIIHSVNRRHWRRARPHLCTESMDLALHVDRGRVAGVPCFAAPRKHALRTEPGTHQEFDVTFRRTP
jgi:hypothetical protein